MQDSGRECRILTESQKEVERSDVRICERSVSKTVHRRMW